MPLGVNKLLKLVKEENLVEGLSERELKNPEGSGFDIRIGELYKLKGKGFLGVEKRDTPEIELIEKYEKENSKKVLLKPNVYYLMKTIEKVNMPNSLLGLFTPRSTLYRSGLYVFGGQIAPGYKGGLTMGIFNFSNEDFELEMGSRVLHIMFFKVDGESSLYHGQWQGGRVTTDGQEQQV